MLKKKRELAKAVKRYPKGGRGFRELGPRPPRDPHQRGHVIMFGTNEERDYGLALLKAEETRDFSEPLKFANASYQLDSGSSTRNYAPKSFWPSGAMYKAIFYRMGRAGWGQC